MKPRFSVIIPVRNEAAVIAKCIAALNSGSQIPDEIIVVDNGSTDATVVTAQKLGARVIREATPGLSHARNRGVAAARFEYVCFVDADGHVTRDWLKLGAERIARGHKAAVSGINIFRHRNIIKKIWYNTYTVVMYSVIWGLDRILKKTSLVGNNLIISKALLQKLGGFDPWVGEDFYLTRKYWQKSKEPGYFHPGMKIYYSSRGFEKSGFIFTLCYWLRAALQQIPQAGYSYKTKK